MSRPARAECRNRARPAPPSRRPQSGGGPAAGSTSGSCRAPRRGEGRGHHLGGRPSAADPTEARRRDLCTYRTGVTVPPGVTVCRATPTRPAISVLDTPSAASNTIRARCARPARIVLDRVHGSNSSRSPGRRPNGCARIPHSRAPTVKLLKTRRTSLVASCTIAFATDSSATSPAKATAMPPSAVIASATACA